MLRDLEASHSGKGQREDMELTVPRKGWDGRGEGCSAGTMALESCSYCWTVGTQAVRGARWEWVVDPLSFQLLISHQCLLQPNPQMQSVQDQCLRTQNRTKKGRNRIKG